MKRRYGIWLEYDGTNYHGWQRQARDCSIQAVIENCLRPLNDGKPVVVIGAGRTDSGVHARMQVAHFDLETDHTPATIQRALNATLPPDIHINSCRCLPNEFHARFSALRRCYKYQIVTRPSVFERHYAWYVPYELDEALLQQGAALVLGEHDFSPLCRAQTEAENKVCQVYLSQWERQGDKLIYTITANRFLHSMVRMIVGCLCAVARHKYPLEAFKNLLGKKGLPMQVYTAPAQGLILWSVEYKEQFYEDIY